MLKEHIKNGLPVMAEIEKIFISKGFKYTYFSSGNIYRWIFMMLIKHYIKAIPNTFDLHLLIDRLYNKNLFNIDKADKNGYRNVIIVSKNSESPSEFFNEIQDEFKYANNDGNNETITSCINLLNSLVELKGQRNKIL